MFEFLIARNTWLYSTGSYVFSLIVMRPDAYDHNIHYKIIGIPKK